MPFREDLDAALAHAEVAERELALAREQNAADASRIAELETRLSKAKAGVERTKALAPPVDEPTQAGRRANTVGAKLGRLQLHHAGALVVLAGAIAAVGAILVGAAFFVWGFEPAMRHGHDALYCGPNCGASLGGQALPLGSVLLFLGLALVYYFRKPTRRRIHRGRIQGGFQWRDLRNVDLAELGLDQCELRESDLRGATLERATLVQCNFEGADLRGVTLAGATFTQCHFQRADLRDATLEGATFEQCEFDGAQLEGVKGKGTTFRQCSIRGTAIAAGLDGATFEQCDA